MRGWTGWMLLAVGACVSGCGKESPDPGGDTGETDPATVDLDGDGATADVDCDDSDATVYPGAQEVCDDLDNNCDGQVDETLFEMFLDSDSDGFGDPNASVEDCVLLEGYVENSDDCNDSSAAAQPGGEEICDGLDNDCDSSTSEEGMVTRTNANGDQDDVSDWFEGTANAVATVGLTDAGDTYSFCTGTYYVNVEVQAANVDLESTLGNADATILDGGSQGSVVSVWGANFNTQVSDLTIRNGMGPYIDDGNGEYGGGLLCLGYEPDSSGTNLDVPTSSLRLVGVTVESNASESGGGLFAYVCDVDVEDSIFRLNEATGSGGAYTLLNASSTLTDVLFESNTAGDDGAAVTLLNYSSSIEYSANWTDVQIESNQSDYPSEAVSVSVQGHNLFWTTTGPGRSSLLGSNSKELPGVGQTTSALAIAGDLSVSGVDFGESLSAEENEGVDLFHVQSSSEYVAGDNASFVCSGDESGCGSAQSYAYGAWDQSMTTTEGFIGHVVYPDTRATVSEFSYGFAYPNCSTNRALIAKRSQVSNGASQSWEVIWNGYGANHAAGFLRSGPVGKVLDPGAYYALLVGFDCGTNSSGINRSSAGVTGFDVGIGSTVGSVSKLGSYTPLWAGDFVTMNFDGLQDLYRTEIVVVEL